MDKEKKGLLKVSVKKLCLVCLSIRCGLFLYLSNVLFVMVVLCICLCLLFELDFVTICTDKLFCFLLFYPFYICTEMYILSVELFMLVFCSFLFHSIIVVTFGMCTVLTVLFNHHFVEISQVMESMFMCLLYASGYCIQL